MPLLDESDINQSNANEPIETGDELKQKALTLADYPSKEEITMAACKDWLAKASGQMPTIEREYQSPPSSPPHGNGVDEIDIEQGASLANTNCRKLADE